MTKTFCDKCQKESVNLTRITTARQQVPEAANYSPAETIGEYCDFCLRSIKDYAKEPYPQISPR